MEIFDLTAFFQPEDWCTVALTDAYELGLPRRHVKSILDLVKLLQAKYPEHNWDKMFILKGKFRHQRRLENAVRSLLPVILPSPSCPPPLNKGVNILSNSMRR